MTDIRGTRQWRNLRAQVFALHGYNCVYCGAFATHVDHIVPLKRGGTNELSNLVPACQYCNLAKGSKPQLRPNWSL